MQLTWGRSEPCSRTLEQGLTHWQLQGLNLCYGMACQTTSPPSCLSDLIRSDLFYWPCILSGKSVESKFIFNDNGRMADLCHKGLNFRLSGRFRSISWCQPYPSNLVGLNLTRDCVSVSLSLSPYLSISTVFYTAKMSHTHTKNLLESQIFLLLCKCSLCVNVPLCSLVRQAAGIAMQRQ